MWTGTLSVLCYGLDVGTAMWLMFDSCSFKMARNCHLLNISMDPAGFYMFLHLNSLETNMLEMKTLFWVTLGQDFHWTHWISREQIRLGELKGCLEFRVAASALFMCYWQTLAPDLRDLSEAVGDRIGSVQTVSLQVLTGFTVLHHFAWIVLNSYIIFVRILFTSFGLTALQNLQTSTAVSFVECAIQHLWMPSVTVQNDVVWSLKTLSLSS